MKCNRIFPEICAKIRCPLGNSTRNIVFGSNSATLPSTSMTSFRAMSKYLVHLSSLKPCVQSARTAYDQRSQRSNRRRELLPPLVPFSPSVRSPESFQPSTLPSRRDCDNSGSGVLHEGGDRRRGPQIP